MTYYAVSHNTVCGIAAPLLTLSFLQRLGTWSIPPLWLSDRPRLGFNSTQCLRATRRISCNSISVVCFRGEPRLRFGSPNAAVPSSGLCSPIRHKLHSRTSAALRRGERGASLG